MNNENKTTAQNPKYQNPKNSRIRNNRRRRTIRRIRSLRIPRTIRFTTQYKTNHQRTTIRPVSKKTSTVRQLEVLSKREVWLNRQPRSLFQSRVKDEVQQICP
jgi:hypothetical protein